ncbi:MAG: hypothetical protein IJP45_02510 [Paludibacteraceae bacterium]|nr:hypothetical protein [Paludibacteraceae bacterium]
MATQRKLYIGANYGRLNFYNEDGTPMESAPYVTLHNKHTGKYYVADSVALAEDELSYDAVFTTAVTSRMTEGVYALEVFSDSTMKNIRRYDAEYVVAVVVSPTPGQINVSKL